MESAKRYFGKVCAKHPELQGERYAANRACVGCNQARYRRTYREDAAFRARDAARHNAPKYRAKYNTRKHARYHTEPTVALIWNHRCRISTVLKGARKAARTKILLGIDSPEQYKTYLEAQFQPGMTWKNYGKAWHVDHRIPLSMLDLSDEINQRFLFNYKNTRPMWAKDNIRRGNRLLFEDLL